MKVEQYLNSQGVRFEVIQHERAFTAQEVAAKEHVTGHEFAKTVVARGESGKFYMLVLPASHHVDFEEASELVGEELEMATEEEMHGLFPDSQIGAEPPFGSQYGVPTFVDRSMAALGEIVFRAGSHDRTVKMDWSDYEDLEHPQMGDFCLEELTL